MSADDRLVTVAVSCYVAVLADLENLCDVASSKGAISDSTVRQAGGDNHRILTISHEVGVPR